MSKLLITTALQSHLGEAGKRNKSPLMDSTLLEQSETEPKPITSSTQDHESGAPLSTLTPIRGSTQSLFVVTLRGP